LVAVARSTSNSNVRGSAKQRRARKQWLLDKYGDGLRAKCEIRCSANCARWVDYDSLTVDRWPIAGVDGGRYVRDNIRPAYGICNYADGGKLGAKRAQELVAA
jgi:hypothetical protein